MAIILEYEIEYQDIPTEDYEPILIHWYYSDGSGETEVWHHPTYLVDEYCNWIMKHHNSAEAIHSNL